MIVIYSDSNHINDHWLPYLGFSHQYQLSNSVTEFANIASGFKVAFTSCRFEPHYDNDLFNTVEERIEHLRNISDLVFVFDYNFFYEEYEPLWQQFPQENVYWVVPGCLNINSPVKHRIINYAGWFVGVTGVYRMIPKLVGTVKPELPKPGYFDALLGRPREHKAYVYDRIINSQHKDKIVARYLQVEEELSGYLKNDYIWDKDCQPLETTTGTFSQVLYHGIELGLYNIIPIDLYNNTAYSIITESTFDNRISFFTEKIAKPILGKRLFVLFSGARSLELLRRMGFKTFDAVIDEGYDLIEDPYERFAAAFAQVEKLCELDQGEVYNKIKDILDHNYNKITQTNWDDEMIKSVQAIIDVKEMIKQ